MIIATDCDLCRTNRYESSTAKLSTVGETVKDPQRWSL